MISSTTRKVGPFTGNGSASVFPFTFKVFTKTDLLAVTVNTTSGYESTLVVDHDYSVALNADQDNNPGGSITLSAGALATGFNLIVSSAVPETQQTQLTNLGGFYPEVINASFDKATILSQQLQEASDRSLKYPTTDSPLNSILATAPLRAGKYFRWGSDGSPSLADMQPGGNLVIDDPALVHVTGNETIAGNKTFTGILKTKLPLADVRAYGAVCDGVTDDTAAWQAAINAAAGVNGAVVCYGSGTSIVTGLVLPSNTEIYAGTTRIKLKAAANQPVLRNSTETFTQPRTDHNITIHGGIWDQNSSAQGTTDPNGATLTAMRFTGVDQLTLDGVQIANPARFGFWGVNVAHVRIMGGMMIYCLGNYSNQGTVQFQGNSADIDIESIDMSGANDDTLALNADDIDQGGAYTNVAMRGTIENVHVGRLTSVAGANGLRLLAATQAIRNVQVDQITGDFTQYALRVSSDTIGTGGQYQNIRIGSIFANWNNTAPFNTLPMVTIDTVGANAGIVNDITIGKITRNQAGTDARVTIAASLANTVLRVGHIEEILSNNNPTISITASTGSEIAVDNFSRMQSVNSGISLVAMTGGTLSKLKIGPVYTDNLASLGTLVTTANATITTLDYGQAALSVPTKTPYSLSGTGGVVNAIGAIGAALKSVTTATYTVGSTDTAISFFTAATCTVTLPVANANPGRIIRMRNTAAFAINSASSNVGPLIGGAPAAAILVATAGKFVVLQSDGANWIITSGN